MTMPSGFNPGLPNPAREVSQTGNVGIPAVLNDAQGRTVRPDTPSTAAISDAGYTVNPNLTPRGQDVQGLTPQVGVQATANALRNVLTEHARTLQADLSNSLRPHTEAMQESIRVQREAAQDQRELTQVLKDIAANTASGRAAPGGTTPPGDPAAGASPPNTADASSTAPARPAGAQAQPGFNRIAEMRQAVLRRRPPNSAEPDPNDPNDPIAVQRQQVRDLEDRLGGSVGGTVDRASRSMFDEDDPDQVVGIKQSYMSGFRSLHGSSYRVLAPIARRLQQYRAPNTPDLIQYENGDYRVRNTGRVSLERGVPNTPDRLATGGELEQFAEGSARTGLVRGIGARIGTLGIAGIPGIGEAAIGVGMGHQAIRMYQNQREANRAYQSVEGGSNLGGMAERGRASMFGFSQMGLMSGDQARQLFQGSTEAGYRGSERNNALQMATDQFRRNGTDIAQTLQLMGEAADTGGKQLTGVGAALNQITDLARKNGQNAAELRQRFVDQFGQSAQTFGSENGANATVTAADVQATAGQGQRFANVSNAGLNTEMSVRMQAAANGMQIGRYVQRASTDPAFRERGQSVMTQRAASLASGGQTQMIQNRIDQLHRQYPGGIPPEELDRLGTDLNNSGTFDPYSAARIESHYGITGITPENAGGMIVRQLSGQADPAAIGEQKRQSSAPTPYTGSTGNAVGSGYRIKGVSTDLMRKGGKWNWVKDHIIAPGGAGGRAGSDYAEGGSVAATYNKVVNQTHEQHPVVQQLLQSGISRDSKVVVNSKGEQREVSLNDAIKYYSDQLDTGNVKFTSGSQKGHTVSEATGGMGTGADPAQAGSANDVKHQHGKKYDPNKGDGGGGTVTITPSPELQQLLRFSGQGNVSIQQGQDTGTAPSSNVTPQQLPVGGH